MKIPVLVKNESYSKMGDKLEEEYTECQQALLMHYTQKTQETRAEAAGEVLDVIQVCIGILDKLESEGLNLEEASFEHLKKLINKRWRFKKILEVRED